MNWLHYPVMHREVLDIFKETDGNTFVDCTVGMGGHSYHILQNIATAKIVALDVDEESLALTRCHLAAFDNRIRFFQCNFIDLFTRLDLEWSDVSGILVDPGISQHQLKSPERGFSHTQEGPLDMRKNRETELTAKTVVNTFSEKELTEIFDLYGGPGRNREVAKKINEKRLSAAITTTQQLRTMVEDVYHWKAARGRVHPAAKVFQALRLFVNRELEGIETFIRQIPSHLKKGARLIFLSYHSLEDRIVKKNFQFLSASGLIEILKPFPRFPTPREIGENLSSRSARLRAAEVR